jgi:hypothetical protein
MLRSLAYRSPGVFRGLRRTFAADPRLNPSTTTSVVLTNLPASLTESKLAKDVTPANLRKVLLQPGCSMFFNNEAEARVAAEYVKGEHKLEAFVTKAAMPCLVLQNVPETINVEALEKDFAAQRPQTVRIIGTNTLQIKVTNDSDAGKVLRAIDGLAIEGQSLKVRADSVPRYSVDLNLSVSSRCRHALPKSTIGST